jgi:hypothetical protein
VEKKFFPAVDGAAAWSLQALHTSVLAVTTASDSLVVDVPRDPVERFSHAGQCYANLRWGANILSFVSRVSRETAALLHHLHA